MIGARSSLSFDVMCARLSDRTLSVRQIVTLDRLEAYDPAARVVGWVFSGPLVHVRDSYVYVPPDGYPVNVPGSILHPESKEP